MPQRDREHDDNATFIPESTHAPSLPTDEHDTVIGNTDVSQFTREIRYDMLVRGDQIGDFRIQRLLGRGSFGAVYLARELTLDRLVALKVVLPSGQHATTGEGRSLARLKHPNIVGVYGESQDAASGCSLLWMQFVDGFNLENLLRRLNDDEAACTEANLLRLLVAERSDKNSDVGTEREELESICWMGSLLADAISHAHRCGITHRDIKPANILVDRDGTPLLADFNLAENQSSDQEKRSGGTVAYMPPEQLADLLGEPTEFDAQRADTYSLGVVLWEMATKTRPYQASESSLTSSGGQMLKDILKVRREELEDNTDMPIGLAMVLRRALHVDPSTRYPSATAMAAALRGLVDLQTARRQAPTSRWLQFVRRNLFWFVLIGGLIPNLAASILQSVYNLIWIETSSPAFTKAFVAYNLVVYPACVGWFASHLWRFGVTYKNVAKRVPIRRSEMRRLRQRMLKLPRRYAIASAVGWFPGIVLYPWLIGVFGERQSANEWSHYGISFLIAGLIATTYSYATVLYFVVCHGYRLCWQTATHYRDRARSELAGLQQTIRQVSVLVGIFPLAAAAMLLLTEVPTLENAGLSEVVITDASTTLDWLVAQARSYLSQLRSQHYLVVALILFGGFGLYFVEVASARLIRVVRALTLADE